MREDVHIVRTTILLLLLGLVVIVGYEAFATIGIPNITRTEPLQQQPPSNISQLVQQQQLQQPLPSPSNISQQPPSNITQQQQPPSNISQQLQQQQQQPLPPPSNISQQLLQLEQQQPLPGQALQQQQPIYQQPPLSQQQQLSPVYQQPTAQVPSTLQQQLPAQSLMQTTPLPQLQNNPAQPYGIPSTPATIQPQLSALPPTATTFPPSVLPPVNSLQPYGTTGGLGYPSSLAGQYGLGAAGAAAGAAITSVSTSSQLISPWFPSLPASYCGGTFLLTIEGTPRGNEEDDKIDPADSNDRNHDNNGDDGDDDGDGDNHKDSKDGERERRLLSLQVNSDNTMIFTDDDAISGEIFLGKNNIDKNKGNDFDIKSIFNDCQVVTYSKA
jgi:hypothetical protein